MTKTFTTNYVPPTDSSEDPLTEILIDGKVVGDIQHGYDGLFTINSGTIDDGTYSMDFTEHRTLSLAIAAAKEKFL